MHPPIEFVSIFSNKSLYIKMHFLQVKEQTFQVRVRQRFCHCSKLQCQSPWLIHISLCFVVVNTTWCTVVSIFTLYCIFSTIFLAQLVKLQDQILYCWTIYYIQAWIGPILNAFFFFFLKQMKRKLHCKRKGTGRAADGAQRPQPGIQFWISVAGVMRLGIWNVHFRNLHCNLKG